MPADMYLSCLENDSSFFLDNSTNLYPTIDVLSATPLSISNHISLNSFVVNYNSTKNDTINDSDNLNKLIEIFGFSIQNDSKFEESNIKTTKYASIFTVKPHAEDCMNLKVCFFKAIKNGLLYF